MIRHSEFGFRISRCALRFLWSARRILALSGLLIAATAFAQAPQDLPEEKLVCLASELAEAGFTGTEVESLLNGRIADPESFVKSRIGEEGIREIGRTCFQEGFESPQPGATPPGERPTIAPAQRACVTQYINEDLLDQILRGSVRPEDVLTPERMQEIGRACFGDQVAPPGEHPPAPPTIDLPPDVIACLRREVGEAAFNEISSGQRQPTPEEMTKGQACFPSGSPGGGPGGGPGGVPNLPPATKQCIAGIVGQEKLDQALRLVARGGQPESLLTPEEMRRVGEACFGGPPPGVERPGQGGPGGPPPEIIACVEGILGKAKVQEFLRGSPPTPEEMEQAKGCFPQGPAGGPGPTGPPVPEPTGEPPPGGGYDQCVTGCKTYEDGRYNVGDFCERACRGEPVQPPGGGEPTPYPTGEPVPTSSPPPTAEPTPYPTPDTAQCVARCTGYQKADGTTYSAEECQSLCAGGQGAVPRRSAVASAATERAAPWWIRTLLGVLGF